MQTILVGLLIGLPVLFAEFFVAFSILGRITKRGTIRTAGVSALILAATVFILVLLSFVSVMTGHSPTTGPTPWMVMLAGFGAVAVYWVIGTFTIRRLYGLETKRALIAFVAIWMAIGFVNSILSAIVAIIGANVRV